MFVHLSHIISHRRIITVWCLFHNLSEMVQKVLKSNKFQLQQTQTRSFLYFKSQNKFETDMKEKKKSLDSPQDGQSASTRLSVWLFTTAFTRAVCSEENEKWLNTGWVSLWQICVYVCVLQCSGMWKVSGEVIYFCLQKPFFALWPTFLPCGQICFYWSGSISPLNPTNEPVDVYKINGNMCRQVLLKTLKMVENICGWKGKWLQKESMSVYIISNTL